MVLNFEAIENLTDDLTNAHIAIDDDSIKMKLEYIFIIFLFRLRNFSRLMRKLLRAKRNRFSASSSNAD